MVVHVARWEHHAARGYRPGSVLHFFLTMDQRIRRTDTAHTPPTPAARVWQMHAREGGY